MHSGTKISVPHLYCNWLYVARDPSILFVLPVVEYTIKIIGVILTRPTI
jgi:hypothetical protein